MGNKRNNKKEEIITIIYLVLWTLFILALAYIFFSIFENQQL